MSDGSDYCNTDIINDNILTSEPAGIKYMRKRLFELLTDIFNPIPFDRQTELDNHGYSTNAMNTEPSPDIYNFNDEDMSDILASYNIPENFLWIIHRSQLNDAKRANPPPPVILLNVSLANINDMDPHTGNHWVVLYRRKAFRDDCPYTMGIQFLSDNRIPAMRGKHPGSISPTPMLADYTIYYPRYKGDCGPDAVRVIMLLYCCWLSRQGATLTRSSSQKDSPPRAKKTGSPEATSKQSPISPLTNFSPEKKQQLADELTAIFTSINQPEVISPDLEDAARRVAKDILIEVAERKSSRLRNRKAAAAAAAAATEESDLADATDEKINAMANLLVNNPLGISSGDSVSSQFSQELIGIARNLNILPPKSRRGAGEYNAQIQEILRKLGVETNKLRIREVYTANKGVHAIDETAQFTDVWGPSIADRVRREGFCYLSGERFLPDDSPEMDHVKFATSAFMECIHYRDLQNKSLCGIEVSKLWQEFISTQPGIDSLLNLYKMLNRGTIKKGIRIYSETDVNTCYKKVFDAFFAFIQKKNPKCDIDQDIFNYSTSMLKFWLAEFAYALHIFNQAKGGLNLNFAAGINAMNKSVKRRANKASDGIPGDPKTFREYTNHRDYFDNVYRLDKNDLLLQNNGFITGRVSHLEQIAAEFNRGYGCVSKLTREQLKDPLVVKVIILMKQLRNILLYSRIQNGPTTSPTTLAGDMVDTSITTPPSEEANLNNRLIELQNEIETLQHKLTTNIRDASRSRTKMEGIKNEIANITNKGVSQEELVNLINSQEDLGNLIDLEEEQTQTRGLFGTSSEQQVESNSMPTSPVTTSENQDGYSTPPQPPTSPIQTREQIHERQQSYQPGPPGESDEDEWEMMPSWSGSSNKNKGGTLKNKRRTRKRIASRRRKITKRLMSRRKRYTRKQKK